MLARIAGRIVHRDLDRVSPLAVPIMLEIGRELVYGQAQDQILAEAANDLIKEAGGAKARSIEAHDLVAS
jgi:ATP-dependent Lhr-like helicase